LLALTRVLPSAHQSCFEDVQALIFVTSVSEYNQRLYEDEDVGRMEESLTLWESVANSRWFLGATLILFLNKMDLFREKLERHPLADYFNDYDGSTFADAQAFMTAHFLGVVHRHKVYPHATTATSTEQMRSVQVRLSAFKAPWGLIDARSPFPGSSRPPFTTRSSSGRSRRPTSSSFLSGETFPFPHPLARTPRCF
jgi:hypothetical protein